MHEMTDKCAVPHNAMAFFFYINLIKVPLW